MNDDPDSLRAEAAAQLARAENLEAEGVAHDADPELTALLDAGDVAALRRRMPDIPDVETAERVLHKARLERTFCDRAKRRDSAAWLRERNLHGLYRTVPPLPNDPLPGDED